jgi:hypothetical protein
MTEFIELRPDVPATAWPQDKARAQHLAATF